MTLDLKDLRTLGKTTGDTKLLQVLVSRFTLRRRAKNGGVLLDLTIDDAMPALTSNADKKRIREALDFDEGLRHLEAIRAFRHDLAESVLHVEMKNFAFRHASAGVLPIVRRGPADHLLFVLRDIHPEGWNIVNGASAERSELADVTRVMQREFAEELIFVDRGRGALLRSLAAPANDEMSAASTEWRKRLGLDFSEAALEVAWGVGPDALSVTLPDKKRIATDGLFLSFNHEDFGIECTRLARIQAPLAAVPADGEISGGRLLDRAIGLFTMPLAAARSPHPLRLYRGGEEKFHPEGVLQGMHLGYCPVAADLLERILPATA